MLLDLLNGDFAAGVGAALTRPIANRNLPSGAVSSTLISPVASSAVMPEMSASACSAFWYSTAPLMTVENDENGPPRKSSRLIVCSKSDALTADPSDYFRLGRSLKV
jgi:hypothetical protein